MIFERRTSRFGSSATPRSSRALESQRAVLVRDVQTDQLFEPARKLWLDEGQGRASSLGRGAAIQHRPVAIGRARAPERAVRAKSDAMTTSSLPKRC